MDSIAVNIEDDVITLGTIRATSKTDFADIEFFWHLHWETNILNRDWIFNDVVIELIVLITLISINLIVIFDNIISQTGNRLACRANLNIVVVTIRRERIFIIDGNVW